MLSSPGTVPALVLFLCLAFPASSMSQTQSMGPAQAAPQSAAADVKAQESGRVGRFRHALASVQPYIERYGYWAAAGAVLAEGAGIPMPGQTLLMAGAAEASEGRINLGLLLFLVALAAVLGNSLGYIIGRWAGTPILIKLRVNRQRQDRLEGLFKRYGGLLILLGRFVDGLRQLNGIVAGMMEMPWAIFMAYNVAGAVLWTGAWGLGTYYLGRRIHFIAAFFHHHRTLMCVLTGAMLLALLVYLFRRRSLSVNSGK